jgi:hypothetical protein
MNPRGNHPKRYNTWPGFVAEKIQAVPDEQVVDLVAPIVLHIHEVIAPENQEYTDWILDYFANIVIRLWQKTQVALSIVGVEGCGKDVLLDWLRLKILGKTITHQTDDLTSDLFNRFSDSFVNKVLIVGDEIKNVFEHVERLKDFISGEFRQYERKYVQKKDKEYNYCNLILTSNNENTINIPPDDRRYCLFRCSDKYKENVEYFNALFAHLEKPQVQRAFFQFLKSRDITKHKPHFQEHRPITKYYLENRLICILPLDRFVSAFINNGQNQKLSASHFYEMYCLFCDKNGYKLKKDNAHFGQTVVLIDGIVKVRSSNNNVYIFDIPAMQKYLIKNKRFDEDAEL